MLTRKRLNMVLLALASTIGVAIPPTTASTNPPAPLVIIVMENKSYSDIVNHASVLPYEMSFITQGVRYTNYTETPNPSLPNYLTLGAGSVCGKQGTDSISAGGIALATCPTTLWNQLEGAGVSWGVYMEDMGVPCAKPSTVVNTSADGGQGDIYALKHNPATPFASIYADQALCQAHVLPYSSFNASALPAVSFISPGICDDQHGAKTLLPDGTPKFANCAPHSNALYARGDTWLANNVPAMLAAGARVIITYDGPSTAMYTVLVGPGVTPGSTDATPYTHCSLLGGVEASYGLANLGCSQSATPLPIG